MEQEATTKRQKGALDLYFWLQALVIALVSLILIFTFIGRVIGVDGKRILPGCSGSSTASKLHRVP